MSRPVIFALLALLAWPCICLAEPATVSKADNLYEKPFADAKVLVKLAAGQKIDIRKREGAWYQVSVAGKLGWVRLLSVRRTPPAAAVSTGSLGQVATGRAGTGRIVATTGVRGLGEEALRDAAFSEAAVAAAERFRMNPAEAQRLARAQRVAPRQIPPLPEPAAGAASGGAP